MKRALLLMVVSALLVTLGFGQPPAAGVNTDPANVKGCLDGSDGNYTVRVDGSPQIIKITTSNVDLKPHVGQDVRLTGHQGGAVGSGAGDSNFAVTELSMISEHCAATAAAAVGAVVPYSQTVIEPTTGTPPPSTPASTPAVEAAVPVSPTAPVVSTPAAEVAEPAATVNPSPTTVNAPAVETAAPVATLSPSVSPATAPTEKAAHLSRPAAHPRKLPADQAATSPATTVSPSQEVSPALADAAAAASPAPAPATTSDATATTPPVTHKTGSLALLISFVVLVIVLGTTAPLIGRWRKRKMLERTGTPNLSFTNDASPNAVGTNEATSDQHKVEARKVA
jgi:hypothetical protein